MIAIRTALAILLVAGAGLLTQGCGPGGEDEAAAAPPGRGRSGAVGTAVVVELFTSQGCSSCPPADRLLAQLPDAVAADGIQLLPLAFHVDYWDDLGWRDPFSRGEWTERQKQYADVLAGGRIYTPQLVVQGGSDVVGSDRSGALAAIRRAARRANDAAHIRATRSGRERLTVAVDADLAGRRAPAAADAWVALVESNLATDVAAGENRGRALVDQFVVRRLVKAFRLAAGGSRRAEVDLAVDPAWRRDRLAVTVFLQDPETFAILAAAAASR